MNIAIISDGIWPEKIGGIQKHSYELAIALASKGVQIAVFYVREDPELPIQVFHNNIKNIAVFPIYTVSLPSFFPGHYLFNLYLKSRKVRYVLSNSSFYPDFVFIQGLMGYGFKNLSFKSICHLHGLEMFQKSYSLKEKILKIAFQSMAKSIIKHTDYQCFYGPYTASLLEELGARNLVSLPNAVQLNPTERINSLAKLSNCHTAPICFAYLGRYEFRKGIPILNEVLQELVVHYSFEFHFIGDIPFKKQLNHPQIFYHGKIHQESKIRMILQKTAVLVLPSFAEGMPTCILEAMRDKTAIVATEVGENSLLVFESNGWIIPPHQKSALKKALVEVLKCDPKKLQEKGEKSFQIVATEFNWDKVVNHFLNQLHGEG